jgi:hypothetical protein
VIEGWEVSQRSSKDGLEVGVVMRGRVGFREVVVGFSRCGKCFGGFREV